MKRSASLVRSAIAPSPVQPLINVGYWLSNRIDAVTTELGWILMPSLRVSEIRSLENFDQIRTGLEQQGVHIPVMAQGGYCDLKCSDRSSLRLYAITWILTETETQENPEWMLLLALGSQPQTPMPKTLKLEVRDETELLFQQQLKDTRATTTIRIARTFYANSHRSSTIT